MPLSTSHAAGDVITAADINAIAAAVNALTGGSAGYDTLRVRWTGPSGIGYKTITSVDGLATYNSYNIKAGDVFKYDMYPEATGTKISLDAQFSANGTNGQATLRDSGTVTDAYGTAHPAAAAALAGGAWYSRSFSLTNWAGLTIVGVLIGMENGGPANPACQFRNARIESSTGNVVLPILPRVHRQPITISNYAGTAVMDRPEIIPGT